MERYFHFSCRNAFHSRFHRSTGFFHCVHIAGHLSVKRCILKRGVGWNGNDTIFLSFSPTSTILRCTWLFQDGRCKGDLIRVLGIFLPGGGAILRFSCCGLQVSYLGADNFGDVFSVANKAANRLDSGRVQPGILFLVVPLRVPQFIPLETWRRGCNWLLETCYRLERLEISLARFEISRIFIS